MPLNTVDYLLFAKNRARLADLLPESSIVILKSNVNYPRNGDQFFPFRQDSAFFYLTGLDYPDLIFMLKKGLHKTNYEACLFIPSLDLKKLVWDGEGLNNQRAKNISGINEVLNLNDCEKSVKQFCSGVQHIFADHNKTENSIFPYKLMFANELQRLFPDKEIMDVQPMLTTLRSFKQAEELVWIKKAISITADGLHQVAKTIKAGTSEKVIEGKLTGEFIMHGASGHAFHPIVASGINACTLHYIRNNSIIQKNDLVLIDCGAEYKNYAADCTRVFPASGKFTKRQAEIYNAVLNIFYKTKELIKPGIRISEINKKVEEWSGEAHIKLGLYSKGELKKDPLLVKRYFPHGACHFMGLDVHDTGDRNMPLAPDMVITCEPGIYIPEEKTGIRLENDLLITKQGNDDLMKDIPIEIVDIERLMH